VTDYVAWGTITVGLVLFGLLFMFINMKIRRGYGRPVTFFLMFVCFFVAIGTFFTFARAVLDATK
jgi:hypothetical protein